MKIYACSNWKLKFLGMILDYWRAAGHEVDYSMGYDPAKHEWSDVTLIDVADHNAKVGSRQRFPNTRTVIRAIDIECWMGQPGGVTWENVDAAIFGALHIKELVESYMTFPEHVEVAHVPFGVDLDKWTYADRGPGPKVACVAHRWTAKNIPMLLQVMAELGTDYSLHLLGTPSREKWYHYYLNYMIDTLGIEVHYDEDVESVDDWLEDKNYLIMPSMKETFSYAAAEAAAKGVRPLIHNFYRATDIWPEDWIWNTVQECVTKVLYEDYDSANYRRFIERTYSIEHMMGGINQVCHIS